MAAKKIFIGGEERAAASLNEKTMPATMPSEEMSPMVTRIATLWLSCVRVFFRIRQTRTKGTRHFSRAAEEERKKVANALVLDTCRRRLCALLEPRKQTPNSSKAPSLSKTKTKGLTA